MRVLLLLASGFAVSGCIPFPYLSRQAGREPIAVAGKAALTPLFSRDAFRPSDRFNLIFTPAWPDEDRAPGVPPVLVRDPSGREELFASVPGGLFALDPGTGKPIGPPGGTASRRARAGTEGGLVALSPPPRVRGGGHSGGAWTNLPEIRRARWFRVVAGGVLAWTGAELLFAGTDGTVGWRLEKTRGVPANACAAGEVVVVSFVEEDGGAVTNAYGRTGGAFRWTLPGRAVAAVDGGVLVHEGEKLFLVGADGKAKQTFDAADSVPGRGAVHSPATGAFPRDSIGAVAWAAKGGTSSAHRFTRLAGRELPNGSAWQHDLSDAAALSPVAAGGAVFVTLGAYLSGVADLGGAYAALQAHDPRDGSVLFRLEFPAGFLSFTADDSRIWVWTRDGTLRGWRWARTDSASGAK